MSGILMEDSEPQNFDPLRKFFRFIWNPKEKTFMERTWSSWGELIIYYTLFFGVLGGIFVGMIYLSQFIVMRNEAPVIQFEDGPGLGYRPMIHLNSPLIRYKWDQGEGVTYKDYVTAVKKFLGGYENMNVSDLKICMGKETSGEKPCLFDISDLGPCALPNFGYDNNTPCVYLKLNKVYNWAPECYDRMSVSEDMPLSLKNKLQEYDFNESERQVWVSCEGVNPADEEHMGEIQFFPDPGFKASFFPYTGQNNFLSPLIAVKFLNPKLGIFISIHCKAWAKNIKRDSSTVDFQLMIDFKD